MSVRSSLSEDENIRQGSSLRSGAPDRQSLTVMARSCACCRASGSWRGRSARGASSGSRWLSAQLCPTISAMQISW